MNWIPLFIAFLVGFLLALIAAFLLRLIQAKTAKELADELFQESELQRRANIDLILENLKANFGNLSLTALSRSTEEFLKLAKAKLESERDVGVKELDKKKALIDLQLSRMTSELDNVTKLMKELERDRVEKFGQVTNQLKNTSEQTAALIQTTNNLREALASSKARGQWGERMAEDVLRLAGFMENVNYLKQKAIQGSRARPDFTFLLPRNLKVNMDVKFPMDNYIRFLEAETELEKVKCRNDFLRDVKARIYEVATRDYINPEQNTVDYVLLFIPNEQIYAFIHEQDSTILDEGIKNRVVVLAARKINGKVSVLSQEGDNICN